MIPCQNVVAVPFGRWPRLMEPRSGATMPDDADPPQSAGGSGLARATVAV